MSKSSSILVFFAFGFTAHAQIIELGQFVEQRYPVFNEDSIKAKGIESITLRLMRKPSSKPIYDDGKRVRYQFDPSGRLIAFEKIFPGKFGERDTTSIAFIYYEDQLKAKSERMGSYRKRFIYDNTNENQIIETTKVKRGGLDWDTLRTDIVEKETLNSSKGPVVVEVRSGKDSEPYERVFSTYNPNEQILSKEKWMGPRPIEIEQWNYEHDYLKEYRYQRPTDKRELLVTYSTDSKLQDSGSWCVDGVCSEWSLVYYPSGLPKGWITINPTSQDMEIWEYRYTYY